MSMIKDILSKRQNKLKERMQKTGEGQNIIPGTEIPRQPRLVDGERYEGIIEEIKVEENISRGVGVATRVTLSICLYDQNDRDGSVREVVIPETFYLQPGYSNYRYEQRFKTLLNSDVKNGFLAQDLIGQIVEVEITHSWDSEGNGYDNFRSVHISRNIQS